MNSSITSILGAVLLASFVSTGVHAQVADDRNDSKSTRLFVLEDELSPPVPMTSPASYEEAELYGVEEGCSSCGGACYCNGWRSREKLFGDWHGARSCLAQRGIIADLQLTQFYQGVSGGGVRQVFEYGGKVDYMFTFLGEPLGINEGFTAILHAETRFGQGIGPAAGALAFPNTNMLYPLPGEQITAITGLLVIQALSEEVALTIGKINSIDYSRCSILIWGVESMGSRTRRFC
jgi:hypothetical protein